jgi:hypothetical protein
MYDAVEVPNVKRMRVVEEEVSLSQLKTIAVPPEEEEVPVPQGRSVAVPSEEEVPPEEEEFPAPAVAVPQGPPIRGRSPTGGRGGPNSPLVMVPLEGRGCLVPVPAMVSSSPFLFSQKYRRFFSPFFLINVVDL